MQIVSKSNLSNSTVRRYAQLGYGVVNMRKVSLSSLRKRIISTEPLRRAGSLSRRENGLSFTCITRVDHVRDFFRYNVVDNVSRVTNVCAVAVVFA